MKRTTKLLRLGTLVMAMAMVLAMFPGFASANAANNTFIYAIEGDPGSDINTVSTSGRYDLMVERAVYSPLYTYYGSDDITYLLAESVELSEDMLTLTARLRNDVAWHDGVRFTADDVVFTYEMIMSAPYANGYDGLVYDGEKTEVVKIDDYTVEFRMPQVVSAIMETICNEHYIMPKHIYEGDEKLDNNPKNATPVGTGPYKLVDYKEGQYVKFEANETYMLGKPKIETLIFQIVTDQNSAALALKKGEINALVITNANADDFVGSDVTIHAYPEDRVGYASFHMGSDRVQDVNFRKACFFAMNRHEMNLGAYLSEDFFVDAYSFLPEAGLYYTDNLEKYDQNIEKAKEYLALCEEIPTIRIAYPANNSVTEIQAMIIQQNLKAIGVTVELLAMESNSMYDKLEAGTNEFEMFLGGYIMGIDPVNYSTLFTTDSASNYAHMSDELLDGLFLAGSVEIDPVKREQIYVEAQQRLADLAIQYPIVTNMRLLGITNDVDGIEDARLVPIYTFDDMSKLYFK